MRKTFVIAIRDYLAAVKTKSFLVSLVLMPILMGGGIAFNRLSELMGDTRPKHVAVIDHTAFDPANETRPLYQVLIEAAQGRNEAVRDERTGEFIKAPFHFEYAGLPPDAAQGELDELRYRLSERLRDGELFAFVEIGREAVRARPLSMQEQLELQEEIQELARRLRVNLQDLQGTLALAGGDPKQQAEYRAKFEQALERAGINQSELMNDPALRELAAVQDRTGIRYTSKNTTSMELREWIRQTLEPEIRARRVAQIGDVDAARVAPLLEPPQFAQRAMADKDSAGQIIYERDPDIITNIIIPIFMVFLMFTVIMTAASPLTTNIVEEKQLRIAEVLLGSVRPFELMLGKLLGGVGVSLTLAAIYISGGLVMAREFHALDAVSPATLAWFGLFAALATLMYGALFVAAGAAVTNLKEAQNFLTPVILVVVAPMFAFASLLQNPDGPLARAMTWFPLTTPTSVVLRQALPPGMATSEKLAAAGLTLATTLLLVWIAGRVFRFGMLHTDKAAALRDMLRWVARG